ncbi:MAG: hypothetical protein LKJ88_04680 [Bacilli bacterium]|nr:hypothetical protein [Bacilli bacterium]
MSKLVCLLSLVAVGGLTSCGEGIVSSTVADSSSAAASSSVVTETEVADKALLLNNIVNKYNTGAKVPTATKYGLEGQANADIAASLPIAGGAEITLKANAAAQASLIKGTDGVYAAGAKATAHLEEASKSTSTHYDESSSLVTSVYTSTGTYDVAAEAEISDQTYLVATGTSVSTSSEVSSTVTNNLNELAHADQKVADYLAAGKITDIAGYAIPAINLSADDLKSVQDQITALVANPAYEIKATQNVTTENYTLNFNIASAYFASLKGQDIIPALNSALSMAAMTAPQAADTIGSIQAMLANFAYIHVEFEDVTKIKANFTIKLNKDYFPLGVAADVDFSGTSIIAGIATAKDDGASDTTSSAVAAEEMPLAAATKLVVNGNVDLTLDDAVKEVKMSADNKAKATSADAQNLTDEIASKLSGTPIQPK